jgi:hypothetical protein
MKVWVGLEHIPYESYWGDPVVFFNHESAMEWQESPPSDDWYYRQIYEAEAR